MSLINLFVSLRVNSVLFSFVLSIFLQAIQRVVFYCTVLKCGLIAFVSFPSVKGPIHLLEELRVADATHCIILGHYRMYEIKLSQNDPKYLLIKTCG